MWNNRVMNTLALPHLQRELDPLMDWQQPLQDLARRIAPRFARTETRQLALAYLQGLLSCVERKNGWQLAEHLGQVNPYRLQHLLDRAVWDAEEVRNDLQHYVVEHLGSAAGVLIVDESGFLKKGTHSVGVKRQYSGTAGRVENCQIGVFLTYATPKGHTFLDTALYLPREWADDGARREQAFVPEKTEFATKPQLAKAMLKRALDAGVPAAWVTADSVYGDDAALRAFLEERAQAYVMAVSSDERLPLWQGGIRALTLAKRLPAAEWQTLSAGEGAKGPRLYDWAYQSLDAPQAPGWSRGLLVRRSLSDPTELAYYHVFAPENTPLLTLVAVAGSRWTIEICFESAKGEVGLDHYEVRSWHGWYRHMTLSLWAHAFLSVMRAQLQEQAAKKGTTLPGNSAGQGPCPPARTASPPSPSSLQEFKRQRGLFCL
jgi:SRSO17 transposase